MGVTTYDGHPVGHRTNRGPTDPGDGPGFPDGVLDAIEVAFSWLCSRPHPVTVDGRAVPGLPAVRLPLDELRARLLDPVTAPELRARVWAYLIGRARTDGPTWTVACAGMALPMLAGLARELTAQLAGDPADIHSEIVAGFLDALATADLTRTPLASLRWAAWRAGYRAVQSTLDAERPVDPHTLTTTSGGAGAAGGFGAGAGPGVGPGAGDGLGPGRDPGESPAPGRDAAVDGPVERRPGGFESAPPPARPGHPDLVLARAVTDGVLTVADAALIGTTRLEAVSLVEAADALQAPLPTVTSWRRRAEARLLTHLTHPGADISSATSPETGPETGPGRGRGDGQQDDPPARSGPSAGRARDAASTRRRRRRVRTATGPGPAAGQGATAEQDETTPVEATR